MPNKQVQFSGYEYWIKMIEDWRKLRPPIRPSLADLKIYKKFLKSALLKKKNKKILVLGATPEMRDLAHNFSEYVVVDDIRMDMIVGMSKLMKLSTTNEIWTNADWLNFSFPDNYFDAVIGDGVHSQIENKKIKIWWSQIRRVLKPQGYFIQRVFNLNPGFKEMARNNFYKLIKAIKDKSSLSQLSSLNVILQVLGYDKTRKVITCQDLKGLYLKHVKDVDLSNKSKDFIFKSLAEIFPTKQKKYWYTLSTREFTREAGKYFKINNKSTCNYKYFTNCAFIYNLKK